VRKFGVADVTGGHVTSTSAVVFSAASFFFLHTTFAQALVSLSNYSLGPRKKQKKMETKTFCSHD
jgi:hypothetical protein